MKESGPISEKTYKDLRPKLSSARPLLKIHKNLLKIRLGINTENSTAYKIVKFLSK